MTTQAEKWRRMKEEREMVGETMCMGLDEVREARKKGALGLWDIISGTGYSDIHTEICFHTHDGREIRLFTLDAEMDSPIYVELIDGTKRDMVRLVPDDIPFLSENIGKLRQK